MLSPTSNITENRAKQWGRILTLILLLVLIGAVFNKRQGITDWFKLYGYTPPAPIVQLANEDTMNSYTKHLFYLNKPQLLPTVTSFRADCPENENTIVLGCYHSGQNGIFIYNVSDPTLAGVQQVTAAHEVLHAIYARLTTAQRNTLDAELENYYQHDLTNSLVISEVKLYQQTEPGSVMDEMSCTFGTEIASLPAPLEAYYSHYFSNRLAIVHYEQQYQGAFSSREAQITEDDSQLATLKTQIDNLQSQISLEATSLSNQQAAMEALRNSGNIAGYNGDVPAYNQAVDTYNANIASVQSLVNQYNQLVATRNAVAGQLTTLDTALDTRISAVPATTK